MLIRLRSRDGLERVNVDQTASVGDLQLKIQDELNIPIEEQKLSTRQELLLSKDPESLLDMRDASVSLSTLGVGHGSLVFLVYSGERSIRGPPVIPAGSFGRKMTVDDMIAKQTRIERQEQAHCASVSFDRDAANVFQHYVHESLAFSIKRGGFMYGSVTEGGEVSVDFVYEPPQQGAEDNLVLLRDPDEEKRVDLIAAGLGMRRVGFIFTQSVSAAKRDYTMSSAEVRQAAELHAESGFEHFATAIVKLEVNGGEGEDGGGAAADVHFEAFQLSDQCVRLFNDGWFVESPETEPKLSKMKAQVIFVGKDVTEVDNDFFLVPVKILDHQGSLSTNFPVENRIPPPVEHNLKQHMERYKSKPYVERISDFHLLFFVARFFELDDIPHLAECVRTQGPVPDGYQLMIDALSG
eukprot:jgi/Mesen1/3970/ME000210S03203